MKYLIFLTTIITFGASSESRINGITYINYTKTKDVSAFNFNRQYLSISGSSSDKINYMVVFDIGRTGVGDVVEEFDDDNNPKYKNEDVRLIAFLKKAQIDYNALFGK